MDGLGVLLLLGLLSGAFTVQEWHELFKQKLKQNAYHQAAQQDKWKDWIDQGDMEMWCVNTTEYQKTHRKTLTAKDMLDPKLTKTNVKKALIGSPLQDQRCELVFPAKRRTVQSILELLWGYPKMGFFPFDPVGGKPQITTVVTMKFKGSSEHRFRIRMDTKNGQLLYDNLHQDPKYLDGPRRKGCFCDMDRAVTKVGACEAWS